MKRWMGAVALLLLAAGPVWAQDGVTADTIKIGSVLALKGPALGLGLGMKAGMEAALAGAVVQGHRMVLVSANDFYEGERTPIETKKLLDEGVFVLLGNVGTPTASTILPMLKERNVPAVGFFTGAGILRPGGGGPIVNYRASYVQETMRVIDEAIGYGVKPDQVCAFVQNDNYGMAGLAGVKRGLEKHQADPATIEQLDRILKMPGDEPPRNNVGPVGVYKRNSIEVKPGLASIKAWEKKTNRRCRQVVTVGAYSEIGQFVRNVRRTKEKWVVTAVSFTGADNFLRDLHKYKTTDRVIMTQVVPLLNSNLPIVQEARSKLGQEFGIISLEGYIAAKMFTTILGNISGPITRESFMKQVAASNFNMGGIDIDFSQGNQGSNMVVVSYITDQGYREATPEVWRAMLR
jgi:branched-chain amino acid transport system substrate-binding protein